MRWLLYFLFILPGYCFAQNFEVSVNGGGNFHFLPINNIYTTQDKATIGYIAGFRANLVLPDYQLGVGADILIFSEYNYLMQFYTSKVYNYIARPLITPNAFLNKKINETEAGYLYAGIMLGPAIAKVGVNSFQYNNGPYAPPTGYTTTYNSATGYVAGIQGGAVFSLTEKFSLNFEAALRYVNYNYKAPNTTLEDPFHYRLFYIPITFGLRCVI